MCGPNVSHATAGNVSSHVGGLRAVPGRHADARVTSRTVIDVIK